MIIPEPYEPLFWWTDTKTPPYRYYCFEGGRSAGKSTAVAISLVLRAATEPIRVLSAREYQSSISDSVYTLLWDTINRLNLQGFTRTIDTIRHVNGSRFSFKGLHDHPEDTLKGFEGADVCWVEEAQTMSRNTLQILVPTIRKDNSVIIYTWNPQTSTDPVWETYIEHPSKLTRKRTYHAHVTYRTMQDAGILPHEVAEQVIEQKDDPDYDHIWLGEPQQLRTNVYHGWQPYETLPPDARLKIYGLDFGDSPDPTAMVAIYESKTGTYIEEEYYQSNTLVTEQAAAIETILDRLGSKPIACDWGGGGTTLIRQLQHDQYPAIPVDKSAKHGGSSLLQGIQEVQQLQHVHMKGKHLKHEYENYRHRTMRDGRILPTPQDGNDHLMDATRYAIHTLTASRQQEQESLRRARMYEQEETTAW